MNFVSKKDFEEAEIFLSFQNNIFNITLKVCPRCIMLVRFASKQSFHFEISFTNIFVNTYCKIWF